MGTQDKKDFLSVNNVTKWYLQRKDIKGHILKSEKQWVRAVDGISFTLDEGETLGVIGESGCGKSTLGRLLVRLEDPTDGSIYFNGVSSSEMLKKNPRQFRRTVQIVFQNPFDALAPGQKIKDVLTRTLKLHAIGTSEEERYAICKKALESSGMSPAEDFLSRYPYELSGGQLQRISIIRSMLLDPPFIVADEPVSMLDVSIRADIINMLLDITKNKNRSMVFISHDIATTRYVSDRIAVMYLGRFVEMGSSEDIVQNPMHPYTQALISNCASIDPNEILQPISLEGEPPTPINAGPGCYFAPRCFAAQDECFKKYPDIKDVGNGHVVFCHRA